MFVENFLFSEGLECGFDAACGCCCVFEEAVNPRTRQAVYGKTVVETSTHPVAFVTTVGPLVAFIAILAAIDGPHPAHRRWPGAYSSSVESSLRLRTILFSHSYEFYMFFNIACFSYIQCFIEYSFDFFWSNVSAS